MAAQLKDFAAIKEKPEHLTKWKYHNGSVEIQQVRVIVGKAWGRPKYKYVRQQVWIPKPKPDPFIEKILDEVQELYAELA